MRPLPLAATAAAAVTLGLMANPARATFVLDTSCGTANCAAGTHFNIDAANKDVSSFSGHVSNSGKTGPLVTATTTGNVDTGAGFANIKPVKAGSLTDLIFTPTDSTLFSDFSFRGQLNRAGFTGAIDVLWTDATGNTGTVSFTVPKAEADFGRLGIVSNDGETLKSVEILAGSGESFKEVKQIEFSFAGAPPPVPAPASLAILGTGLLGFFAFRRRPVR